MKLAEALAERADAQRKYENITLRLYRVARVQEGDEPAESPKELLAEGNKVLDRLILLIRRINKTNSSTKFGDIGDEYSLADAIALRDMVMKRKELYSELADEANTTQDRYRRNELRYISTVNIKEVQAQVDQLGAEYRVLDTNIQKRNWETDLL